MKNKKHKMFHKTEINKIIEKYTITYLLSIRLIRLKFLLSGNCIKS